MNANSTGIEIYAVIIPMKYNQVENLHFNNL